MMMLRNDHESKHGKFGMALLLVTLVATTQRARSHSLCRSCR
jgi:hypothetical protein